MNFNKLTKLWYVFLFVPFVLSTSCKKEEEPLPNPVASFQYEADATDFLTINFSNFSQNASTYSWDFGDGGSSTDESPSHTYSATGTYSVVLTATNSDGKTSQKTESVVVTDPLEAQRALFGDNGKTWYLVADVSTGVYPFLIEPVTRDDIWWAFGGQHDYDDLCVRECVFDDTWTFNPDGTYVFENNGDFWGEGGIWPSELVGCFDATVTSNWTGNDGQDLSGWDSGTHNFVYDPIGGTLTVTGGFIGLSKAGNGGEVTEPQTSVEYTVKKLVDVENGVDTLVVETANMTDGEIASYWISTLVSYDNNSPIVIEECAPVETVNVTFKLNFNEYAGSATTPEVNGTFNGWCGNCNAMTDENGDGVWEVTLPLAPGDYEFKYSADNWADQEALTEGSDCTKTTDGNTNRTLTVGNSDMTVGPVCWNSCDNCAINVTQADLEGSWLMAPEAGAYGVGPGSGDISWFANSAEDVTTRACYFDDVYTFNNNGTFTIQMDGSTWLEPWQTATEGCGTPVAPHDGAGSYTYEVTATTVKVIGSGAFLGLPKAVNGGEISNGAAVPADRTYNITEYLVAGDGSKAMTVEIDISELQDGSAFWTFRLVSQ